MSFTSLGLRPALVHAAEFHGLHTPTPVQAQAIPAVLAGQDVWAAAQTGSGKTVAYALPLLQRLQLLFGPWRRRTQALVLVPTRELAQQVGEVLVGLTRFMEEPPRIVVAFGGVSINPQMMALRGGAEVVVATPGRLLDLVDHHALRLDTLSLLVLDEADRLLDLGFADELSRIRALLPSAQTPPRRVQQLLFSATFPAAVEALAAAHLHEPLRVELRQEAADAPDITQRAITVDTDRRGPLLRHLLAQPEWTQVLVFVATRYATELLAHKLQRHGVQAAALHGEMAQGTRNEALEALRRRRLQVLVVTDLAARGIDIAGLPVVVNYDLPRSADDYTHRIGRTGRAGEAGLAVSFISADTEAHFRLIEKRQGLRVPREVIEGFEPEQVATPDQAAGGIKGKRPSKKDKLRAAAAQAAGGKASA